MILIPCIYHNIKFIYTLNSSPPSPVGGHNRKSTVVPCKCQANGVILILRLLNLERYYAKKVH